VKSVTGEIVEIYMDTKTMMAKVHIKGGYIRVPLYLLPKARIGDYILIEKGVAVAILRHHSENRSPKET
jgi:hydrogenase maturation factor